MLKIINNNQNNSYHMDQLFITIDNVIILISINIININCCIYIFEDTYFITKQNIYGSDYILNKNIIINIFDYNCNNISKLFIINNCCSTLFNNFNNNNDNNILEFINQKYKNISINDKLLCYIVEYYKYYEIKLGYNDDINNNMIINCIHENSVYIDNLYEKFKF